MNVQVQSIHFDADQKLIAFVQEKLGKLTLFHDHIVKAEVILKLEKDTADRANKVAEVKLAVPGRELFSQRRSKTFEEAIDQTAEALRRQMERTKAVRYRKAS
ncbi:MAG: ribosome-associated translation inhibitor RaiA [Flavobacteriales bacterium]